MCTVLVVNTALVETQTINTRKILTLEHWLAAYGARLVQLVGIDQSTQCAPETKIGIISKIQVVGVNEMAFEGGLINHERLPQQKNRGT